MSTATIATGVVAGLGTVDSADDVGRRRTTDDGQLAAAVPASPEHSSIGGRTCRWPATSECTSTDDLAYHVTVSVHWAVRLTGADGRNVALDPINLPLEFAYRVEDIQVVGAPG